MIEQKRKKIGVSDSGVGGLTVVKELLELLPGEDIVYYGDNRNCPYGNRTAGELEQIARGIIGFLQQQEMKAMVIACNTTSSLMDRFERDYPFPIFGVIRPVAREVAKRGLSEVGVIATELTIRSKGYETAIQAEAPGTLVVGEASRELARLVDRGDFNREQLTAEIKPHLEALLKRRQVRQIIYGCTHYPIVGDIFEQLAPEIEFINPAREQAKAVADYLRQNDLLNDAPCHGFDLYTSGSPKLYRSILARLGISRPVAFHPV